ncbi:hypothetical protein BH11ACT1_BH11ACT1_22210 [soil metagenome]
MTRRARLLIVLLVGLAATGLTACGSINTGSEAAAEFRQWMAGTEHVDSLDIPSTNDLPWVGKLRAGVVVEPDATVEQIAEVADRATSFTSRASTTFTIGYTRGDFVARFVVYPGAAAANLAMIELADDIDQSTAATELTVESDGATVTGPYDFLVVFDQLRGMIAATGARAGDMLTVQDAAGTFSIAADRSTGAAGPRAAYEAVLAEFPVTAAQLTDATVDVRVDVAETRAVARLAHHAAPAVTTTVQFGTVTKTGAGDYAAADVLLAALTAAGPVQSSDLTPTSARVTVADLATAEAMLASVGDHPTYGGVYLTLRTADDRFVLGSSGPVTPYLPILDELSGLPWATVLTSATLCANGLDVTTADLTDTQASALGAVLARTPAGTTIAVRPGAAVGFRLVRAAHLTTGSLDTFGAPSSADRELLAAFVSGWNATT